MKKRILAAICVLAVAMTLVGWNWAGWISTLNELKGDLVGNAYDCEFYTNSGEKFMTVSGQKINMRANAVDEPVYTDDGWGYSRTLSSVVTITIDGHQVENCGSTILFIEKGLTRDVDFAVGDIQSSANGLASNTVVANLVNEYKNYFGKPVVCVIQSQLGEPICAFSGDKVYWEVCEDLPKTTKLMIDGKALYIHRANFQIIDSALIN